MTTLHTFCLDQARFHRLIGNSHKRIAREYLVAARKMRLAA